MSINKEIAMYSINDVLDALAKVGKTLTGAGRSSPSGRKQTCVKHPAWHPAHSLPFGMSAENISTCAWCREAETCLPHPEPAGSTRSSTQHS